MLFILLVTKQIAIFTRMGTATNGTFGNDGPSLARETKPSWLTPEKFHVFRENFPEYSLNWISHMNSV